MSLQSQGPGQQQPRGEGQLGSAPTPPEGWSGAQTPPVRNSVQRPQAIGYAGQMPADRPSPVQDAASRKRKRTVENVLSAIYAVAAVAISLLLVSCAGELKGCTSDPMPASKAASAIEWNALTMRNMVPTDEQRATARDIGIELGGCFTEDTYKLVTAATEAVEAMEARYGWSFRATNTRFGYHYDPLFSVVGRSTGVATTTCEPTDGPFAGREVTVTKSYGKKGGEFEDDLWVFVAGPAVGPSIAEKVRMKLAECGVDPDNVAAGLELSNSLMVPHSVPVNGSPDAEDAEGLNIVVDVYIADDAGCKSERDYAVIADELDKKIEGDGLRAHLYFIPDCPDSARINGVLDTELARSWYERNGEAAWDGYTDYAYQELEDAEE